MSAKPNRTPKMIWVIAGVGLLALIVCATCITLFYVVWNLPMGQETQSASVSLPSVRISTDNLNQVQKLYTISQRAKIKTLAWSPDSRLLAVGGDSQRDKGEPIKVWTSATGTAWRSLEIPPTNLPQSDEAQQFEKVGVVRNATFSPDGQSLATTYDYGIKVWNVADGKKLQTINVWHTDLQQVVFSPDGKAVLARVSGYNSGSDMTKSCTGVESWDVVSKRALRCYDGYNGFYVTSQGNTIVWKNSQLFDLATGSAVGTLAQNPRALSHNGQVLAHDSGPRTAEFAQSTLTLTDMTNNHVIGKWDKTVWNTPVAFSPDDTVIAAEKIRDGWLMFSISNFIVVLWDPQSGKMSELDVGASSPTSIAFSPDGRLLAIGMDDGTVQVWGVKP